MTSFCSISTLTIWEAEEAAIKAGLGSTGGGEDNVGFAGTSLEMLTLRERVRGLMSPYSEWPRMVNCQVGRGNVIINE
jgi:hypothetical protein